MNEAAFQSLIVELARLMGWTHIYHTHDSRRSASGFPDLVLIRGPRILFIEIKSETGRVSADQESWLEALRATCAEVYLWKPEHWKSGEIETTLRRSR